MIVSNAQSKALLLSIDWFSIAEIYVFKATYIESSGFGIIYAGSFSNVILVSGYFSKIRAKRDTIF